MQKLVLRLFVISFLLGSCTTMQNPSTGTGDTAMLAGYSVKNTADLTDLVNYLVIKRNRDFENRFSMNAGGGGELDFSEDFVVAIVGLPSNKEMNIDIIKTEKSNDVLNIHYDVNYTWKEQSMTTAPSVLMSVSKEQGINRVNFYSQNTLRKSIEL